MKLTVVGAGYVGCVSAACLAKLGHEVLLVDIEPAKVEAIRSGRSPVVEPGLDALIAEGFAAGRLSASVSDEGQYDGADVAMICVSTPSLPSGDVDLSAMKRVFASLGEACRGRSRPLVVAVRSTVLPSLLRGLVDDLPADQAAGLRLVANPEFLRETTAIEDFERPPFVLLGGDDPEALDVAARIHDGLEAPVHRVDLETAFLVKYASNAYHALKISFANEIADVARHFGADPLKVMSVFTEDRILNVSKAYLRPGFAFGGSCLPKDVRALVATSAKGAGPLALLHAILDSNERRIADAARRIVDSGVKRVAFLGLTFKSGTDDLRESPYLLLAGRLIQSGLSVSVHEPDLAEAQLLGANLAYAESHLPKLMEVLAPSVEEALEGAEGVVLCKRTVPLEELRLALQPFEHVFDLEHRL